MKKEQLTKELKNEGVDEMRRAQLERKLNEGQELTKEEARELKCIMAEEEFLYEGKKPLSDKDLAIMSNALNEEVTRKNVKNYLEDLAEIIYESTWSDGNGYDNEEYTNELNLILAKLNNM